MNIAKITNGLDARVDNWHQSMIAREQPKYQHAVHEFKELTQEIRNIRDNSRVNITDIISLWALQAYKGFHVDGARVAVYDQISEMLPVLQHPNISAELDKSLIQVRQRIDPDNKDLINTFETIADRLYDYRGSKVTTAIKMLERSILSQKPLLENTNPDDAFGILKEIAGTYKEPLMPVNYNPGKVTTEGFKQRRAENEAHLNNETQIAI